MKLLSFIIPAYNAEPYLRKCLNSFLVSAALPQIEIIIINDGSTDSTSKIAHEYVSQYPSSFRLIDKPNAGHGSGINVGSQIASGKFMKIIDADDWITSENLTRLLQELESCNSDVILLPYHTVDMVTGIRKEYNIFGSHFGKVLSLNDINSFWRDFEHSCSFHGIIYNTTFYHKHGIPLIEHVFYEDQEYATIPFCKAKSITPLDIYLYEYLVGNNNQSMALDNQIKRLSHLSSVIEHMINYYKEETDWSEIEQSFFYHKIEYILLGYYKVACLLHPDRKLGRQYCKELTNRVIEVFPLKAKSLLRKQTIFFMLSMIGITFSRYDKLLNSSLYKNLRQKNSHY